MQIYMLNSISLFSHTSYCKWEMKNTNILSCAQKLGMLLLISQHAFYAQLCHNILWSVKLGFLWYFHALPLKLIGSSGCKPSVIQIYLSLFVPSSLVRYLYNDWFGYVGEQCLLVQFALKCSDNAPLCNRSIDVDTEVHQDPLKVNT